jgi:hypothetical protein
MPTNPTQTPEPGKPAKTGIQDDISRAKIDRRISVAPMMDWTDEVHFSFRVSDLPTSKKACLLYVPSKSAGFARRAVTMITPELQRR